MSQSRPTIQPLSAGVTAPEALSVLHQRLLMAEEQAESLIRDMGSFGVSREEILDSREPAQRPVSPLKMRRALGSEAGSEATLWRQCDSMVSRVCRVESLLQTLKLTTFRLETQRELDPSHSARLKEQLSALQQESEEEQRVSGREVMRLQDQLQQACMERDEAQAEYHRLGEALEVATTSKMDLAFATEELKMVKVQMSDKLTEMKQQLSEESARSFLAMKSQSELLHRVEEVEREVGKERRQTQLAQAECQALRSEGHITRQRLQEETERARRLQEQYQDHVEQADVKDLLFGELKSELKSARLALQKQQQENQKLLKDGGELRTAADRVQVLNNQLQSQCGELSSSLRALTMENARLQTDKQATVKAERTRVVKQLREQDLLLEAARRNIQDELQRALSDKVKLHMELETLKADHAQLQQSSMVAQETAVTQKELLERTIERLQGELSVALTEREAVRTDRDRAKTEMCLVVTKLEAERVVLEDQLSTVKREAGSLSSALQRQQEENRRLVEKMADLKHQQVQQMLQELTDNKNQLAYENGKLQTRVRELEMELHDSTMSPVHRDKAGGQGSQTLDDVLVSHSRLQQDTESLKHELGAKEQEANTLRTDRKALEESSTKSGDLSRANRELREKVSELEKVVTNQKARIREQKFQLKQHLQTKEALGCNHKRKGMEAELKTLEALKEEHQKRFYEQLEQQLRGEILELQCLSTSQEGELEAQRQFRDTMQDKCQRLEESINRLQEAKEEAEKKLRDATLESQQISENLEEANKWFRSKFDRQRSNSFRAEPKERGDSSLGTHKERTHTMSYYETKAQSDRRANQPEEQERWASTMQRWETKRELARIARGYRPGGTPPHTHSH
ncbi:coiled-coil domain-containing protein 150 [Aplochiton taeniatus]